MGTINKLFVFISIIFICLGVYLSAGSVLRNDIVFHTDIARDFILIKDMVISGKPSLIGEKIGPIQGLFHGPLWLYLNLPAYLIGHGNPVVVGWGWVIMGIIFLISTYFIVKKIFGKSAALLATLFLSSRLAFTSNQLFNPSGATMLAPALFYFFWKYFHDEKPLSLIFLSLILGCVIQFEAAFGIPITFLVFLAVTLKAIKSKKSFHLAYLFALFIPLSTYLIFDLRHNFIQLNSIISYLSNKPDPISITSKYFIDRLINIADSSYLFIASSDNMWQKIFYLILFGFINYSFIKNKSAKSMPYYLYAYLFLGYWLLTFLYHGKIESYYYGSLQILTIIIASAVTLYLPLILSILLFIPAIVINFQNSIDLIRSYRSFSDNNGSSWQYNLNIAKYLYEDANKDFGYFVLSEDLLAYSPKYATSYAQYLYPEIKSHLFSKKPVTYILISKDAYTQGSIDVRWWEEGQIKIIKTPVNTKDMGYYMIKKYILTPEDLAVSLDPDILQGNTFR